MRVSAVAAALLCAALGHGPARATPRMDIPPPEPQTPESREAKRAQTAADSEAWLPRLVGRFDYTGVVTYFQTLGPNSVAESEKPDARPTPKTFAAGTCDETNCRASLPNIASAKGKADCVAIGTGPGVQCVIHVVWQEEWTSNGQAVEGGVSFLGPAAVLYGLEPTAAKIRYLILNTNGIAEAEAGTLNGDMLRWTFDTRCESSPMDRCRQVTSVRAVADAKNARTVIDFEQWDSSTGSWVRLTSFSLDMRRVAQEPAAQDKRP